MSPIATYDPLGARPYYFSVDGLLHGPTISGIQRDGHRRVWDIEGVRSYLGKSPDGFRTCFGGIGAVGPGTALEHDGEAVKLRPVQASGGSPEQLSVALPRAVEALLVDGRRTAVALSGGLDSALLVALLRAAGRDDIPVFTLATHLADYCELAETRSVAAKLGVCELHVIEAESLVSELPAAIAAAEVPLFNLHPVSRWLLATALKREGFEVLLTGDGADQIFAGSNPRNYLPIIGSMTRTAGLDLRSPFFDPAILHSATAPTPDKAALRNAASAWLPPEIIDRPKTPRLAPWLDVSEHWNAGTIDPLADLLDSKRPVPGADAMATLWTTLGLLGRFMD